MTGIWVTSKRIFFQSLIKQKIKKYSSSQQLLSYFQFFKEPEHAIMDLNSISKQTMMSQEHE